MEGKLKSMNKGERPLDKALCVFDLGNNIIILGYMIPDSDYGEVIKLYGKNEEKGIPVKDTYFYQCVFNVAGGYIFVK